MIEAFIFDVDGVLINSDKYHFKALYKTLNPLGINITENNYKKYCIGKNTAFSIQYFLSENYAGVNLQTLISTKRDFYYHLIKSEGEAMHGAKESIKQLKSCGFKIGVASSGNKQSVELVLDIIDLKSSVDVVVYSEMVSHLKPDPDIYLKASELLKIIPSNCVAIEDSKVGIASARKAGMKVVRLLNKYNTHQKIDADWTINDLSKLIKVVVGEHPKCIH